MGAEKLGFAKEGGVGFHGLGAPDIVVAANDFLFASNYPVT